MVCQIIKRLAGFIVVLLLVAVVIFFVLRVLPGDPVTLMMMGSDAYASPEQIEMIRKEMALDQPILVQFYSFITNALHGDLGTSIRFKTPVMDLVLEASKNTIKLSILGLLVACIVGFPLGLLGAVYENTWVDTFSMVGSLVWISMPLFWLGQGLILIVSIKLKWLPAISGDTKLGIILPAVALGLTGAGNAARLFRTSLLESLREDYIRTARSKGLKEWFVLVRHAIPNSLIPVVTFMGLRFGYMLADSVLVETVFSRPGLGKLVVNSIEWKDYPLIQGSVLTIAVFFGVSNMLVDILCVALDPRRRNG